MSRALYGKPWLFKQIRDYINTGKYQEITWDIVKQTAIEHAYLLWELRGPKGFVVMRKHLLFYVKSRPDAAQLRAKLVRVESTKDVESIFKTI